MTTDFGALWTKLEAPLPPNIFGVAALQFHPKQTDWLLWTGSVDCSNMQGGGPNCRAEAFYSRDHGRRWTKFESYVRTCSWARDKEIRIDEREILCESYRNKKGSQMAFGGVNPLELVAGTNFYSKKEVLFKNVVGFARFSEYLLVAEVCVSRAPLIRLLTIVRIEVAENANALDLQVSLDGKRFSQGLFPPGMRLDNHVSTRPRFVDVLLTNKSQAYTILESSTDSVFLHVTMSQAKGAEWGNVLKSNSNGTYFGLSLDHVNRNSRGYVDFEKVIGLDGIAVMNIVTNPDDAAVSGKKKLQTRITHNDGIVALHSHLCL